MQQSLQPRDVKSIMLVLMLFVMTLLVAIGNWWFSMTIGAHVVITFFMGCSAGYFAILFPTVYQRNIEEMRAIQ